MVPPLGWGLIIARASRVHKEVASVLSPPVIGTKQTMSHTVRRFPAARPNLHPNHPHDLSYELTHHTHSLLIGGSAAFTTRSMDPSRRRMSSKFWRTASSSLTSTLKGITRGVEPSPDQLWEPITSIAAYLSGWSRLPINTRSIPMPRSVRQTAVPTDPLAPVTMATFL